ncbi:MAG: alcohol dehydrogenase catalytic domain-containing protein, partial [Gammaproteobacteria bacterium]|nr:alcohol dehydrogenase catalytic domain-containing protein [Gammaproteobacteria bacterium]
MQCVDLPEPLRRHGEVLIQVSAAGINYADCIIRMGQYASARELHGYPIVPGFEVAGNVLAGDDAQDFPVGAPVFGLTLFGGYCERIVLPVDRVYRVPTGLSLHQAAALPAVFLTAWYALHQQAQVQRGATVLVHSAAGGVGGALVQLACRAGARVCGV